MTHTVRYDQGGRPSCSCGWQSDQTGAAAIGAAIGHVEPIIDTMVVEAGLEALKRYHPNLYADIVADDPDLGVDAHTAAYDAYRAAEQEAVEEQGGRWTP